MRSFSIPQGVQAEDIQVQYHTGVLDLAIPLPVSMLPQQVHITSEGQANGQKQLGTTEEPA